MPNSKTMNVVELILWYSDHIRYLLNIGIGNKTEHNNVVSQRMIKSLSKRVDTIKAKYHN